MRECSKCKKLKENSKFSKGGLSKDGFVRMCKTCLSEKSLKYRRSFNGLITEIYSGQKVSSPKRGLGKVGYLKEELKVYCSESLEFMTMFEKWKESNYFIDLRPTIDRVDNFKGYNFKNIQPMTYRDNINREHQDRTTGNSRALKRVIQFSKDGKKIKEFFSIMEAARQTNSNQSHIGSVCSGKRKSHNGFMWKTKETI